MFGITKMVDDSPVHDESRIDLSKPKNWHEGIDLLRHVASTGSREEANAISKVLRDALDAHLATHACSGASWCLALIAMIEHAVTTFQKMPQTPKN
jgi:hypothetical protein